MPDAGGLFGPLFGDPEVVAALSDRARVQAMLDVEAALARAEAHAGLVPHACVAPIAAAAAADHFDLDQLAVEARDAGNLAIPLVRALTRIVASRDADAARYVHWGATSQDIIDTGFVLQLRQATPVLLRHVRRAMDGAETLARAHAETVMPGRTWLQQATPVTFGLKAAGWLDALDRQATALAAAADEVLVLQFGGASGTLASLGTHGAAVHARLAAELDLREPDLPWHAHRDRLARLGCALGVLCGVLGKIARDVALLAQTEVAEVAEGRSGGSSTMPHKQNPVGPVRVAAAALRAPGLVATLLAAMPQEHERAIGGWQAEWETLPALVHLAAGAARTTAESLAALQVFPERMRANLDATGGLLMGESVAMALAGRIGKEAAHQLVEAASRRAMRERLTLREVLLADAEVTRHLRPDEIDERLDPARYLGEAPVFIARVLARVAGQRHGR